VAGGSQEERRGEMPAKKKTAKKRVVKKAKPKKRVAKKAKPRKKSARRRVNFGGRRKAGIGPGH
jgi:hypothetical protein